jgi:hypothetical protein
MKKGRINYHPHPASPLKGEENSGCSHKSMGKICRQSLLHDNSISVWYTFKKRCMQTPIDLQVNSCRTKEGFLEETLLKKGFFQTIFPKLLISCCNLISGNL